MTPLEQNKASQNDFDGSCDQHRRFGGVKDGTLSDQFQFSRVSEDQFWNKAMVKPNKRDADS